MNDPNPAGRAGWGGYGSLSGVRGCVAQFRDWEGPHGLGNEPECRNSTGTERELAKGTNKGNFSAFQWEQISTEHNRNKKRLHVVIPCQAQVRCSIPQGSSLLVRLCVADRDLLELCSLTDSVKYLLRRCSVHYAV